MTDCPVLAKLWKRSATQGTDQITPRLTLTASFALLATAGNAMACGGAPLCTVADQTDTPLNARMDRGREIFATLRDGTVVRALARRMHRGKPWLYVEKWSGDNAVGWVFDAYMSCAEDESH